MSTSSANPSERLPSLAKMTAAVFAKPVRGILPSSHMPPDPSQTPPSKDNSADPEHHFTPDIPTPPPPPPVPDLLTKPVQRRPAEPPPDPAGLGDTARAWGIAMDFVFTVIAATGLGYAIGKWLGSVLTGLLIGLGLGFALGMTKLFRAVLRANRS